MNKEYKDMLNELHFTREQKDAMIDRLMAEQTEGQEVRPNGNRMRKLPRRLIAAGAAAALLAAGTGAVYTGLASEAFAAVFGTAQTELIDGIGYPVNVSASDAGFTITADAIMGDKYNVNIVYTIAAEDGRVLDAENLFAESDLQLWASGMGGTSWFVDDAPGDNKVQYVMQYAVDDADGIRQGRTTAEFTALRMYDPETETSEVLAEGSWKLRFDLRYEDIGVELLSEPVQVETAAGTAELRSLTVSPLGFRVEGGYAALNAQTEQAIADFEQPESGRWPDNTPYETLTDMELTLHLKDGTARDLGKAKGYACNLETREFVLRDTFRDEVIPLEDMESITVAGQTFEIPAE